ncbi:ABC transporter substrate-binding protein [Roseococcus sp.]|uniref:ABC transporter substrate-binding protein n=1 Tax=Roseococcus sp. TaxID=2109646 RepID=UPI003BA84C76
MMHRRTTLAAPLLLTAARPSLAQDSRTLTIGQSTSPSSIDPHFFNGTPTKALSAHLFDRLVEQTPDTKLVPGLALSWRTISDTVWEFRLRPGVVFSDGHPLTSDDVAFTIERAPNVPNSPGGFGGVVRSIRRSEIVDPARHPLPHRGAGAEPAQRPLQPRHHLAPCRHGRDDGGL